MFKKRGSLRQGKKGQITLFIILGIVLLFSTAIILFIRSQAKEEMPMVPEVTESLPTEIQPVKDFIESCVEITAKDAIEMIGVHGGYIGVTPEYIQYTAKTFDLDLVGMDPTSHEALAVSPEWHIPYWNYMRSVNTCTANCQFDSKRPPLLKTQGSDSVEVQIDRYIEANIDGCLEGLSDFEEEGFKIEKIGNISVRTIITDASTIVFVEYPFKVSTENVESKVSQYMAALDVNLKKMYNLASEISNLAVKNKFL